VPAVGTPNAGSLNENATCTRLAGPGDQSGTPIACTTDVPASPASDAGTMSQPLVPLLAPVSANVVARRVHGVGFVPINMTRTRIEAHGGTAASVRQRVDVTDHPVSLLTTVPS